jgi:hypothetical protein
MIVWIELSHVFYRLIPVSLVVKFRRKLLVDTVDVRLVEGLKTIAASCGFKVLACRIHEGCHVYVCVMLQISL